MTRPIPEFANEDEEREFWATQDSTDYVDWRQFFLSHLATARSVLVVGENGRSDAIEQLARTELVSS